MGNSNTEIRDRMLADIPAEYDRSEGSFPYDNLAAVALEMAAIYAGQADILAQGFGQTAAGSYLDLHAGEYGLTRNPAVKATGTVTLAGANGTVIPAGALVSTQSGTQYETTSEATIVSGTVDVAIRAILAGSAGNVPTGAISSIPVSIPGVATVTNAAPTTGGTDTETDGALRARLLERVRLPATSGNEAHYKIWAKAVPGVGDARILPLWDGPGTVKVVLIDSEKQPASTELVDAVEAYVETQRPIGATVTYAAATALSINLVATLTLDTGYTVPGVQEAIEGAVAAYLAGIAFTGAAVSYAQVGVAILSVPGVLDYSGLTVNGGTANVAVSNTQVAVIGTVTLS